MPRQLNINDLEGTPQAAGQGRQLTLADFEVMEKAPEEHGVVGEFAAGLGRGALRVVATPAYLADVAGEAIGWKGLERAGEYGAEKVEKFIEESPGLRKSKSISKNILEAPELWTDPRWYLSLVGEGLPTILSMLIPGMAAARAARIAGYGAKGIKAARIAGGLTAAMGLEAGGAAEDIRQYEKQTGQKIPIGTKLQSVVGTGVVAGSLEYVPIFAIFGRTGAQKLIKRIITGIATEGSTEGAQELVANAFAKAGYDYDRRMVDGVIESVVGGILLGGGMGAVSGATNFQERVEEADPVEISDILEQAEQEVPQQDINVRTMALIDEGMATGEIRGESFTPEVALAVIQDAYARNALNKTDIAQIKEKYPELSSNLNGIVAEDLGDQIDREMEDAERIRERVEAKSVKERADREAKEQIYLRRIEKDRVATEKRKKALIAKELEKKAKIIKEAPKKPIEKPVPIEPKVAREPVGVEKKEVAAEKVVLYHGTKTKGLTIESLKERKSTQGTGIYFTDSIKEATKYGENVVEVEATGLRLWNNIKATEAEKIRYGDLYEKYVEQFNEHGDKPTNAALKEMGYDGKVIELTDKNEYMLFELSKAKLKPVKPIAPKPPKPKPPVAITKEIKPKAIPEAKPKVEKVMPKVPVEKLPKITKPELEEKYGRFLEKVGKRLESEAIGQDILGALEEKNIRPASVSKTFWEDTFFKLPSEAQDNITKYLANLTGMKPGDVIATLEGKPDVIAKDWLDIAKGLEDDLGTIAGLEGTERGYISLMAYANEQIEVEKVMPEIKIEETKSRLIKNIKDEKGESILITDLSVLGADAIRQGHKTLQEFSARMKSVLSEVWDKIKHLMQKAYDAAKVVLKSERGEIILREEVPKIKKPIKKAKVPEVAVKKVDYKEMLKKYEAKDEIEILDEEIKDLRTQFKTDIKVTPIKESVEKATGKLRLGDIVKEARIITRKAYEAIAKRKKGAALLKLKERYMTSLIKARARKEAKARVTKIIKGLKKINTEEMDPVQAKAVNALLKDIDLTKLSSKKKLSLGRTRQYLDNNRKDTDIPTYVLEDLARLDKTPIRDFTVDEFESLNMAVLNHVHLNKTKQTIRVDRRDRGRKQVLNESISEMKPAKKVKDNIVSSQTGKIGKLKKVGRLIADTFGIRHDHYDLIIESLSGPNSTMDKILYQGVKEGTTKQLIHKQSTFKKFQDDLGDIEKLKIKDLTKWVNETVTTGKFELTHGERMALYNHSLNTDNKRAVVEGGFGFKFGKDPNKIHKMTEAEMDSILKTLTPAELKIAGEPVRNLYKADEIAMKKIFLEKNGFDMPTTEGPYYHKDTMPLARGIDLETEISVEEIKGTIRIGLQKGRLEKRKGVALPIYLNSLFYDINQSVAFSSAYVGLEIALSNASSLLYNPTFRLNMSNKYGEQTWKEIEKGLRDIAGEYQTYTTTEKLLLKAKNRLAVAMLGVNPFVMAKQVLSLPVYLPYIKSRYLVMGVIDTIWHPRQVVGRHKMYSPEYLERVEGGYSRDVADVFKAGAEKRIYAGKKSIKEKFMSGIKLFDKGAVNPGMQGAVLQVLDEFKAGKLSREVRIALDMKDSEIAGLTAEGKMKLAYKYADYATERTQPMFSPEHRSSLSRGSTVEKLATMFGSFTNQALNLTRRNYRDAIRTGDKEAYAKFAKSLMVIFVINTMGVMAIDDIRDRLYGRDDRPLWGRILSSWSAYMFFVRDLASSVVSKIERGTFLGYDVSLPVSRIPELLSNSIANGVNALTEKDIKKRKKAAVNFIDDSLELSMMMYGIPYATPKKLVRRAILGAPDVDSREVKDFKENLKEINVIDKNFTELLEKDREKALKYNKKTKGIKRFKTSFRKVSAQLGRLRKRKEVIMESKDTAEKKRERIDRINIRMTRIAQTQNNKLKKYRRK